MKICNQKGNAFHDIVGMVLFFNFEYTFYIIWSVFLHLVILHAKSRLMVILLHVFMQSHQQQPDTSFGLARPR